MKLYRIKTRVQMKRKLSARTHRPDFRVPMLQIKREKMRRAKVEFCELKKKLKTFKLYIVRDIWSRYGKDAALSLQFCLLLFVICCFIFYFLYY